MVRAVRDPLPVKPLVDQLVADLLVLVGGYPAGARNLAETSGQQRRSSTSPRKGCVAPNPATRGWPMA